MTSENDTAIFHRLTTLTEPGSKAPVNKYQYYWLNIHTICWFKELIKVVIHAVLKLSLA